MAQTPQEMEHRLTPLMDAGVDFFHCSQRRFWEAEFPEIDGANGLNFAGWAKMLTGSKTISVGSVGLSGEFIASLLKGETSGAAPIDDLLPTAGARGVRPDGGWTRAAERSRVGDEDQARRGESVAWL